MSKSADDYAREILSLGIQRCPPGRRIIVIVDDEKAERVALQSNIELNPGITRPIALRKLSEMFEQKGSPPLPPSSENVS